MKNLFLLCALLWGCNTVMAQKNENQFDNEGLKHGSWSTRFENGKLRYKGTFEHGKPTGEMFHFHKNGKIKARLQYSEKSDTVVAKLFNEAGKLVSKGNYRDSKKVGIWEQYKEGRLFTHSSYTDGVLAGDFFLYHKSGEVRIHGCYTNGSKDSIWTEHYLGGNKRNETTYKEGVKSGLFRTFSETKKTTTEGMYLNDERHGPWRFYKGTELLGELLYDKGYLKNPEVLEKIKIEQFKQINTQKINTKDPEDYVNRPWEYR